MSTQKQSGFSLIELMIALLLGLILTSGIISVFLESRRNFTQDELISRTQENGRFALRLLSRELAMGGFMGGVTNVPDIGTLTPGDACLLWLLDPEPVFEIYNEADGGEDTTYDCLPADVEADTDLLVIKRASDEPLVKLGAWEDGFSAFVGAQYYLRTGNGGLGSAEIDIGTALTTDIASIIGVSSENDVWEYYARLIYIGTENGYPSLCVRSLRANDGGTQRCLVNGIEDIQVQVGLDTDGDGTVDTFESDSTLEAGGAVDSDDVLMFRIFVLARSLEEDNSFDAVSRTYQLADHTYVSPVDRYYRRVFETTVQRTNQLLKTF